MDHRVLQANFEIMEPECYLKNNEESLKNYVTNRVL